MLLRDSTGRERMVLTSNRIVVPVPALYRIPATPVTVSSDRTAPPTR
jgi:hypothetical protein